MNNIFLLIFVYILEKVYLEYETIELKSEDYNYYFPLKFPNDELSYYYFSTKIPMSFFPSKNCTYCLDYYKIDNSEFKDENKSIALPYYFYNFTGRLYNGNFSTNKFIGENNFLLFDNLSYIKNYTGRGIFSLSYLNYNFNTPQKIFAIKFSSDGNSELHLGDYDHKRIIGESKTFNVEIANISVNYSETIIKNKLYNIFENNILIEEDNNATYENITYEVNNSVWYMNFPQLAINDKQLNKSEYKLTLDMSASKFYIPRHFFINNVDKILPKDAKCQITREGYFQCQCDEEYKTKFGNFKFITEDGIEFWVNATDYMIYQSSISGSRCNVHLVINYDNDLFI